MSAMDPEAGKVLPAFTARFRPDYPVGYNDHTQALPYLQIPLIAPGYVPKMVFIDRKGVIQAQYAGEQPFFMNPPASIRGQLDKMLKEAPPPAPKKKGGKKK